MKRRTLLHALALSAGCVTTLAEPSVCAASRLFATPVNRNRLRPPGAVDEDEFPARCIRCGRCVEVCPYRSIVMLDIRHGVHAGTPLIEAEEIPCYLCMKCVEVCPTGSLVPISQQQTRMGLAVIDQFSCLAWIGMTLCRTCYDKCPFPQQAIRLDQLRPMIDPATCTGCGICTHSCPVTREDGAKAINIEPIHSAALR